MNSKFYESKTFLYISFALAGFFTLFYLYYFWQIFAINDYFPSRSDPIDYWLDIKAYAETGKLYSPLVMDENIGKWLPCGVHGPGYQFFYGTISKIFGFHHLIMITVNLILFIGMVYFIYASKFLNLLSKNLFLTFILSYFITLWGIFNHTPEFIHVFFAVAIALQLLKTFSQEQYQRKDILILLLIIFIASCFRYSWVMAATALIPLAKNRKELIQYTAIVLSYFAFAAVYMKLTHAPYYIQVMTDMFKSLQAGDPLGAWIHISTNISQNLPLFFYKYYFSFYYFISKAAYTIFFAILCYIGIKNKDRLSQASALVSITYLLALFCFFDAFDTRDLRGLTASFIITCAILLARKIFIPVIICLICFIASFADAHKMYRYMFFDQCVYSGQIVKNYNYEMLRGLKANGKSIITILIPPQLYFVIMPDRPMHVKNILHTPALKLPLRNSEGVPMRYTRNNDNLPPYQQLNKIEIDYVITPTGEVAPNVKG